MLWRSIHRSASTQTPQPNKRQVGWSWSRGAIRRDHAARQCSAALLGRVAALCTPCSPLWDACSPPVHQILNRSAKQCLSRPERRFSNPGARDEFQQVPGVAQAMPWIPGTGNRPAVPLDPLAGTHSAAEKKAEQNAEQPVGHASDMRSGTLVIPPASAAKKDPSRLTKRLPQGTGLLPSAQRPPSSCSRTCVHEQPVGYASDTRSGTLILRVREVSRRCPDTRRDRH